LDQFHQRFEQWRFQSHVSVAAAAVRIDGALIWHSEAAERLFPIYSITKTLAAVCLLRLDQSGVLHVDDPITRWLPDLPVPESVTLARLANHTAGIPDYGPLTEYHDAVRATPSAPWTDEQVLAKTLGKGLLFEPGGSCSYSNVGYLLLRRTIEKATGVSLRHAVADLVTVPLGMDNTVVAETIGDWANWFEPAGYHPGWCAPGVAISTPSDITLFYDQLFAGALVDPPLLRRMLELIRVPGEHPLAVTPSYGMGIMGDPDDSHGPSYGHGGGGPGYATVASIWPDSPQGRVSAAVFCVTNSDVDLGRAVDALLQTVRRT
jgi:D-alanyl-D-alanine carboxypeptidase